MHHRGRLYKKDDILSYNGGRVTHIDWVNCEEISFSDFKSIFYDLGYKDGIELYYKYPRSQAFEQIVSNQKIVEMFAVFRRIRTVNIYICEVNPIALNVMHPSDEEYSDVGEDSEHYEFSEEKEEMVHSEDEEEEMAQNEKQEEMDQTQEHESNTEPPPPCS